MGPLLALLTSEHFRTRYGMYVGTTDFRALAYWIRGLACGMQILDPETQNELHGLREWLHMQFYGPGNVDWISLIACKFGESEESAGKLFEYLDRFLAERSEVGLPTIMLQHDEYVRKRNRSKHD